METIQIEEWLETQILKSPFTSLEDVSLLTLPENMTVTQQSKPLKHKPGQDTIEIVSQS